MPHIFAHLPFPKASLAVLETFKKIAGIDVDLAELAKQARIADEQLGELLARVERTVAGDENQEAEGGVEMEEPEGLSAQDKQRIEQLFEQSKQDGSKAYELKRERDRLEVFPEYEERFLDLFKKPE